MNKSIPSDFVDFDIIGDIHGHSNDLKRLLQALGYKTTNGYFSHPTRKALFLGDYIDRGINVVEVLAIIKDMVDNNQGIALMGNHEYNALCYHNKDAQGNFLREHSKKNYNQHAVTLMAFRNHPELYKMYLDWFFTLPLLYENNDFRAVHACWDEQSIATLKTKLIDNRLNPALLIQSADKTSSLYSAVATTLKGIELQLPESAEPFYDQNRVLRRELRIKWWTIPKQNTYHSLSAIDLPYLPSSTVALDELNFYSEKEKPVFFGHYWLAYTQHTTPDVLTPNACCLDFSVAKSGTLMSYRYSGEPKLSQQQLKYIK